MEQRFSEHADTIEKRFVQQSERLYQVILCATLVVLLLLASGRQAKSGA
jgi:hypothetical protein